MHLFKHGGIGTELQKNLRKQRLFHFMYLLEFRINVSFEFTINQSFRILVTRLRGLNKAISRSGPAGNYMFKVNIRKTRTTCEICSNLTKMTPDRRQWRGSAVSVINFEHILHLVLVFLLLGLSR